MGYIAHHAIVVTGFDMAHTDLARQAAQEAFSYVHMEYLVGDLIGPAVNGYCSFVVAPDGSKEGWDESDAGDTARAAFVAWLRTEGMVDWVEVRFGGDDYDAARIEARTHYPEDD